MITKIKISITLLLVLVFLINPGDLSAHSKRKPKWISNRPIDNNYYIGIGKSNKTQTDYIQIAKNNALADIISEISVKISSNSILYQLDDNTGYKEKYEAQIQTVAKDEIDGYEVVDSWESKEEYWIYYRLNKSDYQRKKREKRERAKNLSKDFYEKAQNAEKEYDINNALIYYVKSFDAIKKYLGEDLSIFTFDGKIYLDNAIYQSIQDIFSRIRIEPEKDIYTIKALSKNNEPVYVKIKLKTDLETQNLSNIPITFSFQNKLINETENVISLNTGKAECSIATMASKGKTQIIKAGLNTDIYFGEDDADNILKNLFEERGTKPFGNLNVVVKELFAYLESAEIVLGNQSSTQSLTNFFKDELSKNFFSFTNDVEKADVIIKINSTIKKGAKLDNHNLHTVFLNCDISIKYLKTDLIIFNESFNNLKGIRSGSFESASQDVILKAEQKIKNEIIPNIRKINL